MLEEVFDKWTVLEKREDDMEVGLVAEEGEETKDQGDKNSNLNSKAGQKLGLDQRGHVMGHYTKDNENKLSIGGQRQG